MAVCKKYCTMGYFEIIRRPNGEFQFTLKSASGVLLLSSDGGYRTKDSCKKGIESVRRNSADRSKFDLMRAKSGRTYFTMRSANGRNIAASEMYADDAARDNAIRAVRDDAPRAKVHDLTKRKE